MEIPEHVKRIYQILIRHAQSGDKASADALQWVVAGWMEAEHKGDCPYYSIPRQTCVGGFPSCNFDWLAEAHAALMEPVK